ncbi:Formamidopyrimidine-DNA glycosylase [subsurface metagenome]
MRDTNDEILFYNEVITMPELPEVETIRRGLQRKIKNKQIKDIVINVDKIVKKPSLREFITKIKGKKIKEIDRRGKYIIIHLDSRNKLIVHLGMTGLLIYPYNENTIILFSLLQMIPN